MNRYNEEFYNWIYIMESGILRNNLQFRKGKSYKLEYDFLSPKYLELKSKYAIESIAGSGSELSRALRLTDEFSPRLTHECDYDNHIAMNASELIEYSLDNKSHGINCRSKAQILNEMCLALGIYARKVWLMPYSLYDSDCHVVNEIWDSAYNKWIMIDITNNEYWMDESKTPLSILEIRHLAALNEFCTPVKIGKEDGDLHEIKTMLIDDFIYICKNLVYLEYCTRYSQGESDEIYVLLPEKMESHYKKLISKEAVCASPI